MYTNLFFNSEGEGSFRKFPVRHAYSLRLMGNMADTYEKRKGAAAENRRNFLNETGFRDYKIVRAIPQHGCTIVRVASNDEGRTIRCDGLFTTDSKVALTMCVADCPPLIFVPPDRDFVLELHVGVMGAVQGIISDAINLIWKTFAVGADQLSVAMGPGIGVCCYKLPWVFAQYGELLKDFLPVMEDGARHCDLRGYIMHQLSDYGVREDNIFFARECTYCSRYPDRSYLLASHHRAKTSGHEERFLAVAALARPVISLRRLLRRSFFTAQS